MVSHSCSMVPTHSYFNSQNFYFAFYTECNIHFVYNFSTESQMSSALSGQ